VGVHYLCRIVGILARNTERIDGHNMGDIKYKTYFPTPSIMGTFSLRTHASAQFVI